MVNPGSTCWSLNKLRIVSPAPIRSMNDAATCTTMSALRSWCRLCVARPDSRSAGDGDQLPLSAGMVPKINPVTTETLSV